MKKVLSSIREQTANIEIFLWNNNKEDKTNYDADVIFQSSENFFCWPRWLIAGLVQTEFVFTLDDDLILTRPTVIQECIAFFEKQELPDDTILGIYGVLLDGQKNYKKSSHVRRPVLNNRVDIVKGRFMFMKRKFAQSIPIGYEMLDNRMNYDDIYVSSFSKHKYIPAFLNKAWRDLPEGNVALYKQTFHMCNRQKAVDRYFQ